MNARDAIFGPEPLYASPCLDTPRRSLSEVRRDLQLRRLDLMRRQLDAEAIGHAGTAEYFEREAKAVTRRLRMIEQAGG